MPGHQPLSLPRPRAACAFLAAGNNQEINHDQINQEVRPLQPHRKHGSRPKKKSFWKTTKS